MMLTGSEIKMRLADEPFDLDSQEQPQLLSSY